ncbi:MAG: galactose mutarotase [Clostridiales Family XIII bacterium]|jgi:aldose 1-epimerase|nr:galactose mutarotase [Clostridiales Family XIII bacterium]
MSVNVAEFGEARLITITNKNDFELSLTNYGAAIQAIKVPVTHQKSKVDVILGYNDYDGYVQGGSFHGSVVGRYGNRIAGATFKLNGETYELDKNENGKQTLHGGFDGYNKRIWEYSVDNATNSVTFTLISPDGDQGYPGTAEIQVTYTLTDCNKVKLHYHVVTDADTPVNLTNHSFFNLAGEASGDVLDHVLTLKSSAITAVDADAIPTGAILDVKGTAFDFTSKKKVGQDIGSNEEQIILGGGYDHNFILDKPSLEEPFATVYSDATGITLNAYTNLPAVQFYSGNFLGENPGSKSGNIYVKRGGLCLETQFYPDSPNHPDFPSTIVKAGEVFESDTVYEFVFK